MLNNSKEDGVDLDQLKRVCERIVLTLEPKNRMTGMWSWNLMLVQNLRELKQLIEKSGV